MNKTDRLVVRITPILKEKFEAACKKVDERPSAVLHEYIKKFVEEQETQAKLKVY